MKIKMKTENLANIAVNKSRVKGYSNTSSQNRTVYLDNNTEFQIELFNPYHYYIGVTITFDNESEGETLFVLRPGERFWLDRYLNTPKKFKFSTYMVENSEEAKEAISENGNVTLKFYKEREKEYQPQITTTTWYPKNKWWDYDGWNNIKYNYNYTCGDNSSVRKRSKLKSAINTANYASNAALTCSCNCNDSIVTSLNSFNIDLDGATERCGSASDLIETGRIEEGSYSSQSFTSVNRDFDIIPFKIETIKLLPTSQKPVTSSDIQKRFCYNCGKKIKDKFKFCPNCGAEQ